MIIAICAALLFVDFPESIVPADRTVLSQYYEQATSPQFAFLRGEIIRAAEADLAEWKKYRPRTVADRERRTKHLATATQHLRLLKAGVILPRLPLDTEEPVKGQVGYLPAAFTVREIVDGKLIGKCGAHRACCLLQAPNTDVADNDELTLTDLWVCVGPTVCPTAEQPNRTLWTYRRGPTGSLEEWQDWRIKQATKQQ